MQNAVRLQLANGTTVRPQCHGQMPTTSLRKILKNCRPPMLHLWCIADGKLQTLNTLMGQSAIIAQSVEKMNGEITNQTTAPTAARRWTEVLTMAEYIEREVLQAKLNRKKAGPANKRYTEGWNDAIQMVKSMIHGERAADVAPVRHGRWIEPPRLYYGAKQYECSLCYSDTFWNKHSITERYPCCPNCGAKMDGGAD